MAPAQLTPESAAHRVTKTRTVALIAFVLSALVPFFALALPALSDFSLPDRIFVSLIPFFLALPGLLGAFLLSRRPSEAIACFLRSAAGGGFLTALFLPVTPASLSGLLQSSSVPGLLLWLIAAGMAWRIAPSAPNCAPR